MLALPLLEIAGFVVVGKQVGALATVALVLASTIAGAMLLKRQGFCTMSMPAPKLRLAVIRAVRWHMAR